MMKRLWTSSQMGLPSSCWEATEACKNMQQSQNRVLKQAYPTSAGSCRLVRAKKWMMKGQAEQSKQLRLGRCAGASKTLRL